MPLKALLIISVIMGLMLFLPEEFIKKLMLDGFIAEYGKFIGVTFLIVTGYIIATFIPMTINWFKRKSLIKKFSKEIDKILGNLSWPDRYLLREFYLQGKDVIEVPVENTEFISLYNKNIIHIASNNVRSFIFGQFMSVTLNPEVKKHITIKILGLQSGSPTEEQKRKIKSERPLFLGNLKFIDGLMNRLH